MSEIICRPELDYTYIGDIRMLREDVLDPTAEAYVILRARSDITAPVMLAVRDKMKEYVKALMACPYQEARMTKRWHFNQYCELRLVRVMDDNGEVAKTIRPGEEWRPFIGEIKEADDGAGDPAV